MQKKVVGSSSAEPPTKKSVLIIPSRVATNAEDLFEGAEETEIAAQITLPTDGGWGWVVLICCFSNLVILDGKLFSFGCLLSEISKEFGSSETQVVFVNSTEIGIYFIISPISSALINRFGFRYVAMVGAIFCSFGTFAAYFTNDFVSFLIFYGLICGLGGSFVNMSSNLIVGFYFEKLRALASSIVMGGSSTGVMLMFPINEMLVKLGGWRPTVLLQSGLYGLLFFLSLTFRPLVSLKITKTEDEGSPTRTVTYLPSMANAGGPRVNTAAASRADNTFNPNVTQRMLNTVSNSYFPTAANVVNEGGFANGSQNAGASGAAKSKITLTVQGAISRGQIKQVQSMVSRPNFQDRGQPNVEVTLHVQESAPKSTSCWGRLCHWESQAEESRPMYRDDAFYDGQINNLQAYQKSMMEVPQEQRTGLEYQMAVTRTVAVNDIQEHRGIFTTAVRRVLATMLDPTFFRRSSFLFLCFSYFIVNIGMLVPIIFLAEKNRNAGVDPFHCSYFVSVIALFSTTGRLIISAIAMKINPLNIFCVTTSVAGISSMLSTLSYNVFFQYGYCVMYGLFISGQSALRSVLIVYLYGLENLTNGMGFIIMFTGFGLMIGSPLAAFLKESFSPEVAFFCSGAFVTFGGIAALPVKIFHKRELQA